MNAKFEQTQVAQCPTCRTAMRVDFNPETGQLQFTSQGPGLDALRDPLMRVRLQEQARPRQVWLLEQHGARLAALASAVDSPPVPECVCGSRLVRGTVRGRVRAWVAKCLRVTPEEVEGDSRVTEVTNRYLDGTLDVPLTCDICQSLNGPSRMKADGEVWTCMAGTTTILHGLSFDVCEECYERHVLARDG